MEQQGLSWSISRANILHYCTKKYYFSYYTNFLRDLSQNIWLETLLLKNLSSLDMRIGEMTHHFMSDYLFLISKNQDDEENINKLIKSIIIKAKSEYNKSKNKDYSQYDRNNKFGLSEHFYGKDIDEEFELGVQKIVNSIDGFIKNPINQEIKDLFKPGNIIFIEPRVPNFDTMKFVSNEMPEALGVTIRAQPDFGVISKETDGQKLYSIFDRKSGKDPEYAQDTLSDQLKVYAYKMLHNLGLDNIEKIKTSCHEVFLTNMKIYGNTIKQHNIDEIRAKISDDVKFQKTLIKDSDIIKNIPLFISQFPRTEHINKCTSCRFRDVCEKVKSFE